jgi:hypothetical protein
MGGWGALQSDPSAATCCTCSGRPRDVGGPATWADLRRGRPHEDPRSWDHPHLDTLARHVDEIDPRRAALLALYYVKYWNPYRL